MLYVLPINNYQAYNTFGGKSLYCGATKAATPPRGPAARSRSPSTGRCSTAGAHRNRFFGPDFDLLPGSRSRATTSPTAMTSRSPPNPAQLLDHEVDRRLRPLRVLARRAVQSLQGGPRRRRQHRLLQRQHRLLEGPLRGRQPHARLLQDGPGRGSDRQRRDQRQRLGSGRRSRAPPTTRSASTAKPAPPTTTRRTRPPPSATTARRLATRRSARWPRRPRHAREPALRRDVRRRQRCAELPASPYPRATPTKNSPPTASGATPASPRTRPRPSARGSSAGSGTRSRPRPSTSRASQRRQEHLRDQRTDRQRQLVAARRGAPAQYRTAPRPTRHSGRVTYTAPSGAQVFASGTMRMGLRPLRRSRRTDRAGDLQRLLRHGGAAGHP